MDSLVRERAGERMCVNRKPVSRWRRASTADDFQRGINGDH